MDINVKKERKNTVFFVSSNSFNQSEISLKLKDQIIETSFVNIIVIFKYKVIF